MAMTPAGQRDQRIAFERAGAPRGALGVKTPGAPVALGSRWAKVLFGTGAERRAAAVEQAVQSATFRCLADELTRTIVVSDSIVHRTVRYDVTGIAPIGVGPAEFEFTGTASRG